MRSLEECFKQADSDFETAEYMFAGGRYLYAAFLCHLSIEKALKGLYLKNMKEIAPKSHNLPYLADRIGLIVPEHMEQFVVILNEANIAARYPDDLDQMQSRYTKQIVRDILDQGKEFLTWLKQQ